MKPSAIIAKLCIALILPSLIYSTNAGDPESMTEKHFTLKPIGAVHKENGRTTLVLNRDVAPAVRGLDGFSHVWVFWWFDRNDTLKKRSILQVHPRGNKENPLTGVFACRAPVRPNPIALTLCRILSIKNNVIELDKIDAFADTPILDLKPYIPGCDSADASTPDWLRKNKKTE